MKRFLFNCFFLLCALIACSGMFILKYQVLDKEEQLKSLHAQIIQNQRTIHVLKAEWTHLNDPERIRFLIAHHTTLNVIKSNQLIELEDVAFKEAPLPSRKPEIIPASYEE